MTVCRYNCKTQNDKCCFECDQKVDGKKCAEVCTKKCYLLTGGKVPRVVGYQ